MKPFYTTILLILIGFTFDASAQCDPNKQWVDYGATYPPNIIGGQMTDIYNDELYVLARVQPASAYEFEVLKLDTITNTWDSITSFTETCALYSFKVFGNEIFVGGAVCNFNGSTSFKWMARYDGNQWNPVPEFANINNGGIIHDFEIYNGELYASGSFSDAVSNLNGIAKYDGTNWIPVGLGLQTNVLNVSGFSMEIHNGLLYVSGRFVQSAPLNNTNIAAFDGNNWLSVPPLSGISSAFPYALLDADTCLIVAGQNALGVYNNCGKLQNGVWQVMAPLAEVGATRKFERINGEIYTSAPGGVTKNFVHRYHNGNWEQLPTTEYPQNYCGIVAYKNRLILPTATYSCGSTLNRIAVLCDTSACGVLEGRVYVDENLNCIDDVEPAIPSPVIQISPLNQSVVIDSTGHYRRLIPAGNYDVFVQTPSWYSPYCPSTPQNVNVANGNVPVITDFSLEADPNIQDLEITATPLIARVGQPTAIHVTVRNIGTVPLDALVDIAHNGIIGYDSSNFVVTSTGVNQLQWNAGSLDVYESKTAILYFTTPPNITLLGQHFLTSFNGSLANGTDPDLTNNADNTDQQIIAAYDPNKKTVSPVGDTINGTSGYIPPSTNEFEYTIYFQNTGIDTAFNIVILDTIQSILDISTFTLLSSSHNVQPSIIGNNLIQFAFDNILLPDSSTNLLGSQGFVKFRIRPATNLVINDVIENQAEIYFDINPPIYTNTTINTVVDINDIEEFKLSENIVVEVYPNPFNTTMEIKIKGVDISSETHLQLYNLQGQLVESLDFNGETVLTVKKKNLSTGVYVMNIVSDNVVVANKKVVVY
jgi:hypothetical protein